MSQLLCLKINVVGATGDLQTESEIAFLEERVQSTADKYKKENLKIAKHLRVESRIFRNQAVK